MATPEGAPEAWKQTGASAEPFQELLPRYDTTLKGLLEEYPPMGTPDDVAEFCNLKPDAVRQLCREGKIKAVKFGALWRIPRSALAEYCHANNGGSHE